MGTAIQSRPINPGNLAAPYGVAASSRKTKPYLPSGSVLFYPGNPGTGSTIYDFSGNGNNGTISGAAWARTNAGLWCLNYDGSDDRINVTDAASLDLTTIITLEAWVYLDTKDRANCVMSKFQYAAGNNNSGYLMLITATNTIQLTTGNNLVATLETTDTLTNLTWYHLVADISTGIYINGVLSKSGTIAAALANNLPLLVGGRDQDNNGVTEANLDGKIALPRVYNTAVGAVISPLHYAQERHYFGV